MKKNDAGMLLAIDIGNSTIGLGLFPDANRPDSLLIRKLALKPALTAAAIKKAVAAMLPKAGAPASSPGRTGTRIGAIVSSVAPSFNSRVIRALGAFCSKPLLLDHRISGLRFRVLRPEAAGPDRLANAVAACGMSGRPAAVADFGTATTITAVGRNRTFLGGAIMPGIDTMLESLALKTAKLPALAAGRPESALGRDTAAAIRSGVVIGTAGAVMHIIENIEEETGLHFDLFVTGGRADLLAPFITHAHTLAPNLVFEGLRLAWLSKKSKGQIAGII
jgi:type III pantothenate kinase